MKGSLVDIAVAFVMGAAFKEVVTSFTSGVVSPIIGLIFKADFKALKYVLQEGSLSAEGVLVGESAILWGGISNAHYRLFYCRVCNVSRY